MPLAAGCATLTPIIASDTGCSTLVPDNLTDAVKGAPAPEEISYPDKSAFFGDEAGYIEAENEALRADLGEWQKFGVAQTGQLAKSNRDKTDGFRIIADCEKRDRAAIEGAKPRFRFF